MPANLPAEARAKWIKVLEARTKEEKLKALQEYLSAIPKHKGTENLVREVRRKIARLRKEIEEERKKSRGKAPGFAIRKEGDIQLVLLGFPNSGKSSIVKVLTGAKTEINERPFTTLKPVPGALIHKGVIIQLIDAPSLMEDGSSWNKKILLLARNADGLLIVLDAVNKPRGQLIKILSILKRSRISIIKPSCVVEFKRGPYSSPVIVINGKLKDCTIEDVRKMLIDYSLNNVKVTIWGEGTLSEIEEQLSGVILYKPTIILLNKSDLIKTIIDFSDIAPGVPVLYTSTLLRHGFKELGELILNTMDLIRVYTKEPFKKEPSERPLIIKRGATVMDVAEKIHRDLIKRFRYAKIWGKSVKYPGTKVGIDHVLEDGDIIEIRAY